MPTLYEPFATVTTVRGVKVRGAKAMASRWSGIWPSVNAFWFLALASRSRRQRRAIVIYTEKLPQSCSEKVDDRPCRFHARVWIKGHGYCHRHAKRIKP